MKTSFTLQGKVAIIVTVHGFRVQRFRVHLKPSCHSLARLPKFYGGPACQNKVRRPGRYDGQALTVDSWVMTCHASAVSRREAERMKTERLEDIES